MSSYIEYPKYEDSKFNIKIAAKEEFRVSGKKKSAKSSQDIEKLSKEICESKFTLRPHQIFIRNFLSFQTPYNSLILFHDVGTGKTCSAISVAEEMRSYMKQIGFVKQIIIVASPNVQNNFRKQLFDENKLEQNNNTFNLSSCVGNEILSEVNPNNSIKTKEELIKKVNKVIDTSYKFMGYIKFSKWLEKLNPKQIKDIFEDRLVIIDEVHNIRNIQNSLNRKNNIAKTSQVSQGINKLVTHNYNMRLLLLSATPMFNSYREIIWLLNIINKNEKKMEIKHKDIFNKDGGFLIDSNGNEIGKHKFIKTIRGYVSFVRGENPYTFPYKLYPSYFADPKNSILKSTTYNPNLQYNDVIIPKNIEHIDVYLTTLDDYQQNIYEYIINSQKINLLNRNNEDNDLQEISKNGYTKLIQPIYALNIVFPHSDIDLTDTTTFPNVKDLIGKKGFSRIVKNINSLPLEFNSQYLESKRSIFSPNNIHKYSAKIKTIVEKVKNSKGICLIYSQYIYSGLIPIACALEEYGFNNKTKKFNFISDDYKKKNNIKSNKMSYVIISGQKNLSESIQDDINITTSKENINGDLIKVILISRTGSEGIDFKNIRNVHILDPWYNMNRNEQIKGRAIRDCSHKDLPFNERNVEIYLYGTDLQNDYEALDVYIYRICENKSILIGNVSRLMKEHSVDCLIQDENNKFQVTDMNITADINISSGKTISYEIGDKPFSSVCDYMESCQYSCKILDEENTIINEINSIGIKSDSSTLNENHINLNINTLKNKIKDLFGENGYKLIYSEREIIQIINYNNQYSQLQIDLALYQLTNSNNKDILLDKYGNKGYIICIDDMYIFQPLYSNNKYITMEERSQDIGKKRESIEIIVEDNFEKELTFTIEEEVVIKIIKNIKQQIANKMKDDKYIRIKSYIIKYFADYEIYEQQILCEHFIEKIKYKDLCKLFIYIINKVNLNNEDNQDIYNLISLYVNKHRIDIPELKINSFIVPNDELTDYVIITKDNASIDEVIWNYTDELTVSRMQDFIEEKFIINKDKVHSIFGFNYIKGPKDKRTIDRGIKIKLNTTTKSLSIIAATLNRGKIIETYSNIDEKLKDEEFIKFASTNTILFNTFVLELILRLKDKNNTNNKRYFLSLQEALYNSNSKYLNLV